MNATPVEILLVEDNAADLELTLEALRDKGLANQIHVARDGAEALDFLFHRGGYAGRADGNPKVVLLDLKLPKVSGLEVLKEVRANPATREIPVVVLTSSRQDRDLERAYALGVNSYIVKPVDFAQFSAVVRTLGYYWLLLNERPGGGAPP